MKFSIWPSPERPPAEVLELARLVDDPDDGLGWFGFWYADHYMPNTGDESFKPGDIHECWSILPAVAAVTNNVRIGPLVAPTSVHHPALLANRAATLDHLSGGRFVLGLGAGWQINEHVAYGIALEPPGRRVTRFEESIRVVSSLLDNDRTTFEGDFYRITDAPCDPKPTQQPLPILVGSGSPRMLGITARYAHEWNTWGAPDLAGEKRQDFVAACERAGRDPGSMHTSVQALIVMTDDQATIDAMYAGAMGDRTIAGSDDFIVEQLERYSADGYDEFCLLDVTLGATPEARMDGLRAFNERIVRQLH